VAGFHQGGGFGGDAGMIGGDVGLLGGVGGEVVKLGRGVGGSISARNTTSEGCIFAQAVRSFMMLVM
jgi:hypothetical protein